MKRLIFALLFLGRGASFGQSLFDGSWVNKAGEQVPQNPSLYSLESKTFHCSAGSQFTFFLRTKKPIVKQRSTWRGSRNSPARHRETSFANSNSRCLDRRFRRLPGVVGKRNHSFLELAFKRISGRLDCVRGTNVVSRASFALIQSLNQILNQRSQLYGVSFICDRKTNFTPVLLHAVSHIHPRYSRCEVLRS